MARAPSFSRRTFVAGTVQVLVGCAETPLDPQVSAARDATGLAAPRVLIGGFLAPPIPLLPGALSPARPGTGAFVRFFSATALAMRGTAMLVADPAAGRLWRVDLGAGTVSGVAGAPTGGMPAAGSGLNLMLGADESAWVLEPGSRQLLRFARDGRLLQTFQAPVTSGGFVLADAGATVLMAEPALAQWIEQRLVGGVTVTVRPRSSDGSERGIGSVDAIALGGADLLLMDGARGVVHRVQRDGRMLQTLGAGVLKQPQAMAGDRLGRVWVVDGGARLLQVLWPDGRSRTLDASALRLQLIGGLAVDERTLALADRLTGQVLLYPLPGADW